MYVETEAESAIHKCAEEDRKSGAEERAKNPFAVRQMVCGGRENVQLRDRAVPCERHDVFLQTMKTALRARKCEEAAAQPIRFWIAKDFAIRTHKKIEIALSTYYKFPFDECMKNDQSLSFRAIYNAWQTALMDVAQKLERCADFWFFLVFRQCYMYFADRKCTICNPGQGTEAALRTAEIEYAKTENGALVLDAVQTVFLLDEIANRDQTEMSEIPFIFSKTVFRNAIVYSPVVKKTEYDLLPNFPYRYKYEIADFVFSHDLPLDVRGVSVGVCEEHKEIFRDVQPETGVQKR